MAEWTGQKRTLNSISAEDDPPLDATAIHVPPAPRAPGAMSSPQLPGMTPDQPDLPGKTRATLSPLASNRRPLSEYGSAQRLLRLFTPDPGVELQAADWEQGPAAREELRKADSALLTPIRPLGGHGLGIGRAAPAIAREALEAIGDAREATTAVPSSSEGAPDTAAANPAPSSESGIGDIPAGSVAGDGTTSCPSGFPIKGNARSKIFHTAESRVYAQTIAEFCFSSAEAAQAAGYHPPKNA